MTLGSYHLTRREFPMDDLYWHRSGYALWLWSVEEGAFECPIEPLTPEFWQQNADSRLVNGLLLPAWDPQRSSDLLVLVTQELSQSHTMQFGGMSVRERYRFFKYVVELGLPHTETLSRLHPFVRITYLKTLEETFRANVLPIKKGSEGYRHPSICSDDLVLPTPNGLVIACPRCKQPGDLNMNVSLQGIEYVEEQEIRVYCVCEVCEQPFHFDTITRVAQDIGIPVTRKR